MCNAANHVRVIGTRVSNSGAGGISSFGCDYLTIDSNQLSHVGYGSGWSSAISLNTNVWSDRYDGFHDIVANNVISGSADMSANHSDGNGVIVDHGNDTPPVLIADNVVYANYARCIHSFYVSNVWIVNDTCYKNALRDNPLTGPTLTGEYTLYAAVNVHLVNDVVNAWTSTYPYKVEAGSTSTLQRDVAWGGRTSQLPAATLADPLQYRSANPLFVSPPYIDPYAARQYASALPPWSLGNDLRLQAGSTLVDAGIDPRTASGLTANQRADMAPYVTRDVSGQARPLGATWDVGAYEAPGP
jgi:hypothetical protein